MCIRDRQIAIGFATSMIVALFEEYLFRGVLFTAFQKYMSPLKTLLLTSFLFMVYHYQAQPLVGWPYLFIMGVLFGNFRLRGTGLCRLILLHGLVDAAFFLYPQQDPGLTGTDLWAYAGLFIWRVPRTFLF
ncbi:MAG: CPBP family intramembrane glutamic endopeptidase, partial [Chitinophagaceae bacterium]